MRGVCGQEFHGGNRTRPQSGHQTVTGPRRLVPDKQYDTALTPWMKSHPGFQLGNFLHALAPRGLAPPSSVLVPVSAPPARRCKLGHSAKANGEEISCPSRRPDGELTSRATDVDSSS